MMLRMGANLAAQMLDEPAISSRAGGASGCEVGGLSQWGSGNIVCPNIPKLGGRSDHPPPGRTMFAATRFEKPPTSPPPALDSTRPRGRTARPRRSAARPSVGSREGNNDDCGSQFVWPVVVLGGLGLGVGKCTTFAQHHGPNCTASPIVNRNLCPRFSGIGNGRGDGRLSRIRPGVRCKAMEAYR